MYNALFLFSYEHADCSSCQFCTDSICILLNQKIEYDEKLNNCPIIDDVASKIIRKGGVK